MADTNKFLFLDAQSIPETPYNGKMWRLYFSTGASLLPLDAQFSIPLDGSYGPKAIADPLTGKVALTTTSQSKYETSLGIAGVATVGLAQAVLQKEVYIPAHPDSDFNLSGVGFYAWLQYHNAGTDRVWTALGPDFTAVTNVSNLPNYPVYYAPRPRNITFAGGTIFETPIVKASSPRRMPPPSKAEIWLKSLYPKFEDVQSEDFSPTGAAKYMNKIIMSIGVKFPAIAGNYELTGATLASMPTHPFKFFVDIYEGTIPDADVSGSLYEAIGS